MHCIMPTPAPDHRTPRRQHFRPPGDSSVLGWAVAMILLVAAFAGTYAYVTTQRPAPSRQFSVALNPWPGYEFATLAAHLGYFRDEGLDVRLLELSSLGDARRAFEHGQADAFFGTITEVLHSREQTSRHAQIVSVVDYSDGADVILAAPHIKTAADLRGQRVGIEAGSLNAFVLYRALELNNIPWDQVQIVHVTALDMPSAMAQGKVDAVVAYPPMSLEVARTNPVNEVFTTRQIPGEVVDILAFDAEFLISRQPEVEAFCRAFHRAQQYAQANPDSAYAIMAARQRISPEEFRQALHDGVRIVGTAEQAPYFGPSGKLHQIAVSTARALRLTRQLKHDVDLTSLTADLNSN